MLNVSWAKKRAGFVRVFAVQEGRRGGTVGVGGVGKRENDRQERHKTKKIRKDWTRRKVGGGGGGGNGGGKNGGEEREEGGRRGVKKGAVGGVRWGATAGCFGLV